MLIQTLFEPLKVWSLGGYSVVRTKDLQSVVRRLHNAETGFDYSVRREIPRIQASRDQHMLNAQKLRERLASLTPNSDRKEKGE